MPRDSSYALYFICLAAVFFTSHLRDCAPQSPELLDDFSASETGSNFEGSFGIEYRNDEHRSLVPQANKLETGPLIDTFTFGQESPASNNLMRRKRKPSNLEDFYGYDKDLDEISPASITCEPENYKRKCNKNAKKISNENLTFAADFKVKDDTPLTAPLPFINFVVPPSQPFPARGLTPRLNFDEKSISSSESSTPSPFNTWRSGLISPMPLKNGFYAASPLRRGSTHTDLAGLSPESVIFSPIHHNYCNKILKEEEDDEEEDSESDLDELNFDGFGFYDIDEEGRINGGQPI